MSQRPIPQNIFGDQTNKKTRVCQPPGGASSIVFGGDDQKAENHIALKRKNHQASNIFGADENSETTKKARQAQPDSTKSHVFGGEDSAARKEETVAHKSFNPITGEASVDPGKLKEEEKQKDASVETVNSASTSVFPARIRQPPGGKSAKLW